MEPAGKRRKLAPKLNASTSSPPESHPSQYQYKLVRPAPLDSPSAPLPPANPPRLTSTCHAPSFLSLIPTSLIANAAQPHPSQIVPDAPHHSQRHEFEAFARHLNEAAILINRQSDLQPPRYADVSVLLLSWQDDSSADNNIRALQQVLESEYRYRTETWQIPTVSNPSIKLSVQIASFLENARPNQLLIIYYSGHGFIGPDGQLYWACSPHDDSARLKWDGVRCLFEDAHSDMLLLLDTCSIPDSIASSHGVKQVVAAYSPETAQHSTPASRAYFTPCLTTALRKLRRGPPFSAHSLYNEIKAIAHANPNSASRFQPPSPSLEPEFFTMTPDKSRNIELAPLPESSSNTVTPQSAHAALHDRLFSPEPAPKLTFDEARILVCTTFVGEPSPDMAAFNSWLQNTPPLAAQVTVEGMFLGPPTVLLISMPKSLWASVQHDKIWYFLGHITSRNMASLYGKLVAQSDMVKPAVDPSVSELTGADSSTASRHAHHDSNANVQHPIAAQGPRDGIPDGQTSPTARLYQSLAAGGLGMKPKPEVADSAEMQAAEQLKALSDVRHRGGDDARAAPLDRNSRPVAMPNFHPGFRNLTRSESMPVLDGGSGSVGAKIRRILGKPDIRCAHCTHAPFKDSSSLRKHIAAAHTRPFPCAFHFGGCTSTFGSKNEWKRHIASQHLCLQFYRCSVCSRTSADGKGNEFNRKDLFTQHLRRMHAPPQVKRALAKGDNAQQSDWDTYVKEMQQSCLIQRRHPPQRSNCPKPGCTSGFEGPTAWDEWTEHVGRHMEKGEGDNLGVDALLRQYALDEGIIEPIGDNQYRLCPTLGNGGTVSQPASQPMSDIHDSQPFSTQNSIIPPLEDSQPWGARSLPPLPPHPLHSPHDRNPSQLSE